MSIATQVLPRAGHAREQLRQKGQFWTPNWVAEPMVAYALLNGSRLIFDPAAGEGAFLRAAKCVGDEFGVSIAMSGTEVDASALDQARASGLSDSDLSGVELRDFILNTPAGPLESVVANPPYIRHHRLSLELKSHLRRLAVNTIGKPLDGRAGLHVYFLLQALQRLAPEGRLSFIVPADISEGVFAPMLWQWITSRYCLDAVVTFDPSASPFPQVDTNALVFLLRNTKPCERFLWTRVREPQTPTLKKWVVSEGVLNLWRGLKRKAAPERGNPILQNA